MGMINVKFFYQEKEIGEMPGGTMEEQQAYNMAWHLTFKYGIDKMRKMEYEGEDLSLKFHIENIKEINWESFEYPNETVRGKVLEIVYYTDIYTQLSKIEKDIECFNPRFSNTSLSTLGWQAIQIVEKVKKSKYLNLFMGHPHTSVLDIDHTLKKEVDAIRSINSRTSKKRTEEIYKDAKRQLSNDVHMFAMWFRDIKTDNPPAERQPEKWKTNIIIEHEKFVWGADILKTKTPAIMEKEIPYQLEKEFNSVIEAYDSIQEKVVALDFEGENIYFNDEIVKSREDVLEKLKVLINYHLPKSETK